MEKGKKRFVVPLGAILVLLLLSGVSAQTNAKAQLIPLQVYETTTVDFNLTINNHGSQDEIKSLYAVFPDFTVTDVVHYDGWQTNTTTDSILWYDGSLATNVLLALFEFSLQAPQVDSNDTTTITVTSTDVANYDQQFTFEISVENDYTPPELTNNIPQNGAFIKQGTNDQTVQVDAYDPETGIAVVTYNFEVCGVANTSGARDLPFMINNTFGTVWDVSAYADATPLCFEFYAENNGGSFSTINGIVTIDGVAPAVNLIAPVDGAIVNMYQDFSFNASDNLAPYLDCEFLVDGSSIFALQANNSAVTSVPSTNVTEGQHTWSVSCMDLAGWLSSSETWTYILDRTPPTIELVNKSNNSIIADSDTVEFRITDNYELASASYTFGGNTTPIGVSNNLGTVTLFATNWPDGPNDITITAEDSVGNVITSRYTIIVDRGNPTVQLLAPPDGNESDVHVNFTFTTDDDWDQVLDCDVLVDNVTRVSGPSTINTNTILQQMLLPLRGYKWYVSCVDDAGNVGVSNVWTLDVVDRTPPDITFNHDTLFFRGEPIIFNVTVDDLSVPIQADFSMETPDGSQIILDTTSTSDTPYDWVESYATAMNSTLGDYRLDVDAEDGGGYGTVGSSIVTLTYRYIVTLNDASATVGNNATVTGTVRYDNGSIVSDATIEVIVDNVTSTIALVDGDFSFAVPTSVVGTYAMGAEITPSNGILFSDTATLTVKQKKTTGGGDNGGGGNKGGGGSDGGFSYSCGSWTNCLNGVQSRTCTQNKNGGGSKTETRSCSTPGVQNKIEKADSIVVETIPEPEPEEVGVNETEPAAGVGQATGLFGLTTTTLWMLLLILAIIAALIGGLYYWSREDEEEDMDSYLNKRAK